MRTSQCVYRSWLCIAYVRKLHVIEEIASCNVEVALWEMQAPKITLLDSLKGNWSKSMQQNQRFLAPYPWPTMQLCRWVTSMEAIHEITCSFFRSPRGLYATFFTHAVVPPNICKHTLMCKIGGVTLKCNNLNSKWIDSLMMILMFRFSYSFL